MDGLVTVIVAAFVHNTSTCSYGSIIRKGAPDLLVCIKGGGRSDPITARARCWPLCLRVSKAIRANNMQSAPLYYFVAYPCVTQ